MTDPATNPTAAPLVVPIHATPFGVVPLPGIAALNPRLIGLIVDRMRAGDAAPGSSALAFRSREDLFQWADPLVAEFRAGLLGGVRAVVDAINEISPAELDTFKTEARAWFSVVDQHGYLPATSHPLTAWCAIYCAAAPEPTSARPDSGILRLYESRLNTMFQDATNSVLRLPYRPGHYGWRPVPGQMAVFPGSVTHEVAPLRSPGRLILVTARVRYFSPAQVGFGRW